MSRKESKISLGGYVDFIQKGWSEMNENNMNKRRKGLHIGDLNLDETICLYTGFFLILKNM